MSIATAIERSELIKMTVTYDGDFNCMYHHQFFSGNGEFLSTLLGKDVRRYHAHFVVLLNRRDVTTDCFIDGFKDNIELLEQMLDFYLCQKSNLCQKLIFEVGVILKKRRTVAGFLTGIDTRIAERRAQNVPMFICNDFL